MAIVREVRYKSWTDRVIYSLLTKDGHMSDRNIWEIHYDYNIPSSTYVHLLVLPDSFRDLRA